jgi:DNA-binding winged helix-turn-helix (wHTH) protein
LLEHPGEIVTRDEIQKRLWPAGTYVDYDNAINGAVRKLRVALGDNAERARFIETLARRGYRFIAPVSMSGGRIATADGPEPRKHVASSICLIGRERERTELLYLLDAAIEGHGSMVLIGGEPGIGKTHLTRAVLNDAARRGCFAMIGHCYEMEGVPPYVPFIEMLEQSARVVPRAAFRQAIGDCGPEIAKLMPELRRMYSDIRLQLSCHPNSSGGSCSMRIGNL